MRLSGLAIAAILLVSTTLPAQHFSGGGGSSAGASHSSYSGGPSSAANNPYFSSSVSHSASPSTSSHPSTSYKSPSTKAKTAPEKEGSSFWHPFRKAKPVQTAEVKSPVLCFKGPCAVCPRGQSRNGAGACVIASNACPAGQSWNGFACGTQGLVDCRDLAQQLAAEREQMRGESDYGQSLRYRLLQEQYQQCLMRAHAPFGAYALNDAFLLDTP